MGRHAKQQQKRVAARKILRLLKLTARKQKHHLNTPLVSRSPA